MYRNLLTILILSFFLILCVGCTRHPTGPTYIVSKYITYRNFLTTTLHYHIVVRDKEGSYDYRVTNAEYSALQVGDKWGRQDTVEASEELKEVK